MPGGQFGGGGASGKWSRGYGSRGGWSRTGSSRLFTRRRSRIQGGHGHVIGAWSVPSQGSEGAAVRYATNIINPAQWLDKQWNDAQQREYYEGNLQETRLYHGEFRLTTWSASYVAGVQLYVPTAIALVVIPWYDNVGQGDPVDWVPAILPYLFARSFGHHEMSAQVNDPTPAYPQQRARIIHRWWGLSDHTDLAYGNASKQNKYSWTLRKRITIRHNEALWLCVNAYNTHLETSVTVGWQLGYTIGFTHRYGG